MAEISKQRIAREEEREAYSEEEYSEMELLERLECLLEDMEDLGVTTLAEVQARIDELHQRLDARD
jgi:hypothetical protein